jgi:hypothetical protein
MQTKKVTLKEIAKYLGVDDLKITNGASGTMYTARSRNTAHDRSRVFIAWDKKQLRGIARGLFEDDEGRDNGRQIR